MQMTQMIISRKTQLQEEKSGKDWLQVHEEKIETGRGIHELERSKKTIFFTRTS